MTLQLDPPELGRLRIDVQVRDSAIGIQVRAETQVAHDLLQSRIRNFKRMNERRVIFSVGVTYETSRANLVQIPELLREIVESHEQVRFDRAHFKEFGDFALVFEVVYYVLVPDYNLYMDIQQSINLRICERFEKRGVEFAYPTQKLFLANIERH